MSNYVFRVWPEPYPELARQVAIASEYKREAVDEAAEERASAYHSDGDGDDDNQWVQKPVPFIVELVEQDGRQVGPSRYRVTVGLCFEASFYAVDRTATS